MSSKSLSGLSTQVYADVAALYIQVCGNHSLLLEGDGFFEGNTINALDDQPCVFGGHSGEPTAHMPVNLTA